MLETLSAIGGIVLVDLVLSGDNALVIGSAAAGLPPRQRWYAIVGGGTAAFVLRVVFAAAATLLLQLPLLQAIGGALLLVIAIRLLASRAADEASHDTETAGKENTPAAKRFIPALLTILVADVTMSLDNVLAVGALAAGHLPLLAAGLLLSIAIVLAGSALVAALIKRLPWLLDLAALLLGWTAAGMVLHDLRLGPVLDAVPYTEYIVPAVGVGCVLAVAILLRLRRPRPAH